MRKKRRNQIDVPQPRHPIDSSPRFLGADSGANVANPNSEARKGDGGVVIGESIRVYVENSEAEIATTAISGPGGHANGGDANGGIGGNSGSVHLSLGNLGGDVSITSISARGGDANGGAGRDGVLAAGGAGRGGSATVSFTNSQGEREVIVFESEDGSRGASVVINGGEIFVGHQDLSPVDGPTLSPNYADCDLTGEQFVSMHLIGVSFAGSLLRDAQLVSCTATGASFKNANLRDADLVSTQLVGANFEGANLSNVSFTNVNLAGANFYRANLKGATFTNVDLMGANFEGSQLEGIRTVGITGTPRSLPPTHRVVNGRIISAF